MLNQGSPAYDMKKAVIYAQLSIESNPNYPMGYFALAHAYYMQNNPDNRTLIAENLQKALSLNPDSYNSYELR
jgi:tetratricopeptide (TPR) repeat protein